MAALGQIAIVLISRGAAFSGVVDAVYLVAAPAVHASCAAVTVAGLRDLAV